MDNYRYQGKRTINAELDNMNSRLYLSNPDVAPLEKFSHQTTTYYQGKRYLSIEEKKKKKIGKLHVFLCD